MPVVNGNTGEFYALTTDEACIMVAEVSALVAGRAPLLAGVGRGYVMRGGWPGRRLMRGRRH